MTSNSISSTVTETEKRRSSPKLQIVWKNVFIFAFLHAASLYAIQLVFTSAKLKTIVFAFLLYVASGVGVTAGVHRLWAHRSYKAKWPLRLLLAFFNSVAFQNDIYEWSRDHRVHHKFSETDADPHNAKRGFFFSHIGWLMVRKHPDVIEKGKIVDCSDILADPIVRFQRKYYTPIVFLSCFVIPTVVPVWSWGESYWNAFYVAGILRYCWTLNVTWLVNSAAHMWGNRPYDRSINPRENKYVIVSAMGEGFHNYHHTFPWDYSTSEFGTRLNVSTVFIDFMAALGLAYDRKTVSPDVIKRQRERHGDGSY
ncbi:stearoyl-CoA desaturase 5-like [Limulus polyphemus]|uniref:Stearoyl-CoA desaturase 5-like n=1 Tax=Limulus polyphemus TaxID=6850 RepID=A0ABM1BJ83_LIMPO|nr:stearoyl-CoA desaturase 5-like [Limulus polyphemus]